MKTELIFSGIFKLWASLQEKQNFRIYNPGLHEPGIFKPWAPLQGEQNFRTYELGLYENEEDVSYFSFSDMYENEEENALNSVIDTVNSFLPESIVSSDPVASLLANDSITYNYPSEVEASVSSSISEVFVNTIETPLPFTNQTTNLLDPTHLFQKLSTNIPRPTTFLAPDGGPGDTFSAFGSNMTFTPVLNSLPFDGMSPAEELGNGTDDGLKGFTYALLGVAALATTFFLASRAVYRGWQRRQTLAASRANTQQREQRLQELFERQKRIDKQLRKERYRNVLTSF